MTIDDVSGSNMGVFMGIFNADYQRMHSADPEDSPLYELTGTGSAMLANRVSYAYNLMGPSFVIDTGCSGSLVAMHVACQSVANGDCQSAIVGSAGLILAPDMMFSLSNLG